MNNRVSQNWWLRSQLISELGERVPIGGGASGKLETRQVLTRAAPALQRSHPPGHTLQKATKLSWFDAAI